MDRTNLYGQEIWARRGEAALGVAALEARAALLEARTAILEADSGWIIPAFQGTWGNYGGTQVPARYRKKAGIVHVQGLVNGSNIGTVIFNLPVGYRPAYNTINASVANNAFARVDYEPNGNVSYISGANTAPAGGGTFLSLNFSFPAEQ